MCDCNESPYRDNRSDIQEKCNCCYKNRNTKPKGKFGVAYIIETPTRKCKPCGWEVEFTDTPSNIENNCEKMMNWITCPPLGICQNKDTKLCCSASPKEILNNMQTRYNSNNDALCDCCNERYMNTKGDDCCCKKPTNSCCCKKEVNQNQCCNRENNIQKQCCCLKKQEKIKCCGALNGQKQYLQSKNKNTKCCCVAQSNDSHCCSCKKAVISCCKKAGKTCRFYQSDSQSSIESCCCKNNRKRKSKNSCDCNCSSCRCVNTQTQTKSKEHNNMDVNSSFLHKHSKNSLSFEPKKEKQKIVPKSPYTLNVPKKDPDKNNFYQELSEKLSEYGKIKTPNDVNLESELKNTSYENDQLENNKLEENDELMLQEAEGDETDETNKDTINAKENDETTIDTKENDETTQLAQEITDHASPPKKKIKRSELLKKIKEEHRKEMEAIHPTQKAPNVM